MKKDENWLEKQILSEGKVLSFKAHFITKNKVVNSATFSTFCVAFGTVNLFSTEMVTLCTL